MVSRVSSEKSGGRAVHATSMNAHTLRIFDESFPNSLSTKAMLHPITCVHNWHYNDYGGFLFPISISFNFLKMSIWVKIIVMQNMRFEFVRIVFRITIFKNFPYPHQHFPWPWHGNVRILTLKLSCQYFQTRWGPFIMDPFVTELHMALIRDLCYLGQLWGLLSGDCYFGP